MHIPALLRCCGPWLVSIHHLTPPVTSIQLGTFLHPQSVVPPSPYPFLTLLAECWKTLMRANPPLSDSGCRLYPHCYCFPRRCVFPFMYSLRVFHVPGDANSHHPTGQPPNVSSESIYTVTILRSRVKVLLQTSSRRGDSSSPLTSRVIGL